MKGRYSVGVVTVPSKQEITGGEEDEEDDFNYIDVRKP